MKAQLESVVRLQQYPLTDEKFRASCKQKIDQTGVITLPNFLHESAVGAIQREGLNQKGLAYYTVDKHTIYLSPPDPNFAPNHARNRLVNSSKGCITSDQIPMGSPLRVLYDSQQFRDFLCVVLGETQLHEYADPLSSINLHYAAAGQELGWHYDNSSFAITLLIQEPDDGGVFEYVSNVRNADSGEMNYAYSEQILDGDVVSQTLPMNAGTLVLFRGRNSMHRVTPVMGERTRMLAVLAYNSEAGVSLSESARMTFFGRLA